MDSFLEFLRLPLFLDYPGCGRCQTVSPLYLGLASRVAALGFNDSAYSNINKVIIMTGLFSLVAQ